ncbi:hypothetical protein [Pleionea sediminis]|uniref:hypothetical protein n=1 Tax=Pleionea sediminis TaxID=2569479 RepID=UPI001184D802|nr:hypothetical protein [Pleionea sediminis]
MLTYKGFVAQLEYEPESDCILGEVINAQDVLIFEGKSLKDLKSRFSQVIDEYLELNRDSHKSSVTPFVGRFTICLNPDDQERVFSAAKKEAIGVQHWLNRELQFIIKKIQD